MQPSLGTTNVLLGIMAVVSVLEALVVIGLGMAGWIMYRQVMELVNGLEQRHVVPLRVRVDAILDDVKGVTGKLREETDRVDHAIRATMDRVDDTADRVRANVRAKTSRIVGFVRGMQAVIEGILRSRHQPPEGGAQSAGPARGSRAWDPRAAAALGSPSAADRV
jgi:hypothetical protein